MWIERITGESSSSELNYDQKSVHEALKDGVLLCK